MTDKPNPRDEGKAGAERDITRLITMAAVGMAALIVVWPSVKEFVTPIMENIRRVTVLERDVADLRRDLEEIRRFFPRQPMKAP